MRGILAVVVIMSLVLAGCTHLEKQKGYYSGQIEALPSPLFSQDSTPSVISTPSIQQPPKQLEQPTTLDCIRDPSPECLEKAKQYAENCVEATILHRTGTTPFISQSKTMLARKDNICQAEFAYGLGSIECFVPRESWAWLKNEFIVENFTIGYDTYLRYGKLSSTAPEFSKYCAVKAS